MTHTIDVQTPHGLVKFHYCIDISTPTDKDASAVDLNLPTGCSYTRSTFLAVYLNPNSQILVSVASTSSLSTFSCTDRPRRKPAVYGEKDAADDVAAFMDAIALPPCVVFGVSMGTIIGLRLALSHSDKVTGLFLVSPLGGAEPEVSGNGRRQIFDTWREAFTGDKVDQEALDDTAFGGLQLCWNSRKFPLADALYPITFVECIAHWQPETFPAFETTIVTFFTDRKGYTHEELATLRDKPVILSICSEDIVYPPEYFAKFAKQLEDAGVDIIVQNLEGAPHFGSATHHNIVNPLLAKFVPKQWKGSEVPPPPDSLVVSPFEPFLREAGWEPEGDDSDDEY
ncbi:alpha/beta-hydrolase [Exidia glandulosa HHB12029]|uniref:Alpha/beta-hydrolase n=1 Tax=Exidia glandulosa HHB12029 TaxID=1314781 RepID=A0A165H5P9_EXIGL|nr:alpha/beta-hydrolase [Exidia glandulosa HHB12029]